MPYSPSNYRIRLQVEWEETDGHRFTTMIDNCPINLHQRQLFDSYIQNNIVTSELSPDSRLFGKTPFYKSKKKDPARLK